MESDEVMIEGFLEGTEISQGVYKTKDKSVVLPATEVVTKNEFFDYDAKYNGQVQEITPARLSPETAEKVAQETSRIYDILHANGIIRIDYIISKDKDGNDKINMLEINTTPGMTVTSFIPQQVRAAGLDIKDVLSDIVQHNDAATAFLWYRKYGFSEFQIRLNAAQSLRCERLEKAQIVERMDRTTQPTVINDVARLGISDVRMATKLRQGCGIDVKTCHIIIGKNEIGQ